MRSRIIRSCYPAGPRLIALYLSEELVDGVLLAEGDVLVKTFAVA
jgi:hypothetical protein